MQRFTPYYDQTAIEHPDGDYVLFSEAQAKIEAAEELAESRGSLLHAAKDEGAELDAKIAATQAERDTLRAENARLAKRVEALEAGQKYVPVPQILRQLSKTATRGPWTTSEGTGHITGGWEPGEGPDDDASDDDGFDPDKFPLCVMLEDAGPCGEDDAEFIVASVNYVRAMLAAAETEG